MSGVYYDPAGRKWIDPVVELGRQNYKECLMNIEPAAVKGAKHDGAKTRLELVDAIAIEGLGDVLTFGAKKYAAHNWRGGIEYSRILGALKRHLSAIERGEDIDPESGLPHVDHLGCCWMFLSNFMKTRPDLDDRWKDPRKE